MDTSQQAIDIFDASADAYQEKFMGSTLYHDSLDVFCGALEAHQTAILELGCGPGNITHYLLQQRPDFVLLGTDLAPNMLALARKNNPTATFELLDCRAIGSLSATYDGIVCGFCLPYLSRSEAIQFIQDAAEKLNQGGVLYISTMEDAYEKSGLQYRSSGEGPALFMYYHESAYLLRALETHGFELLDLRRQVYPEQADSTMRDLILIARKA